MNPLMAIASNWNLSRVLGQAQELLRLALVDLLWLT